MSPKRCQSRENSTCCSDDDFKCATKRQRKTLPLPSLDELFPAQTKLSDVKKLELCAHNSGSAVFTTRNSKVIAVQYSHLLWGMPWTTLRLTFLNLWTTRPQILISSTCKLQIKSMTKYSVIFLHRTSKSVKFNDFLSVMNRDSSAFEILS